MILDVKGTIDVKYRKEILSIIIKSNSPFNQSK